MPEQETIPTLIQTKLHRPTLPVDLMPRPCLMALLEQHRNRPLTLISAPAGYGKTTLINEHNQIDKGLILVLDDFHLIENQVVHDL